MKETYNSIKDLGSLFFGTYFKKIAKTKKKKMIRRLGKPLWSFFDHSKWFENSLENGLKNGLENSLTFQISKQYKWSRFKDIVQGFGKLKKQLKKLEWN